MARRVATLAVERVNTTKAAGKRPRPKSSQAEAIVEAAARCFDRWGIQRTRVEDIAAEARIPRPHVYRHFASKDAIIHAVVLRAIKRHHQRLAQHVPLEGPASEVILATLISGVRDAAKQVEALTRSDSAQITARSLASSPEIITALRDHWQPILEYARGRGELRDDINPDEATRWLVFVQLAYLSLREDDIPLDRLEHELRSFVLPALLIT